MFSTLPFATATEIQNTTFNVTQSSSVNTVTEKGLKIGANGTYVVELQKWLKEQGYYIGDIDGSFGPYTEIAVKYFQNDSDILVDGWVANQTVCAMKDINGVNIFEEVFNTSTSSSNVKSTDKTNVTKSSTTTTKSNVNKTSSTTTSVTKKHTTSTATSTTKKTSTASYSTLSSILASGAKYGYSHSASTAAGMIAIGSGDCWAMSEYLYGKLSAAGIHSRIVQYSTAYSARHRSVQLYQNGAWVDVPYSSYGYSTMFKATSSKPGMTVLASS
ncbi:peptidoglycan-binding domain-containing protein [Methanobacterium sp.]|uniref:peptidoglycan-binding domain-containing protein n=1 Tax=Methanobacterium sp. TaxID=2164 RepID=UPI003C768AAF